MPNYSLVINSRYNPFSYQELVTPALRATEAHQALEDAYGELSTKASVWENMANEQTDPKAYRQYKKYANDLKHQADILATEGLSVTSRGALNNIRARYSSDIVPIEQAYQARAEEAKAQYAGRAQGMVYEGDAANSSLDRYLGNTQVRYNQANSQEGFKRLGSAAAALAKGLADYGRGKNIDNYTGTFLQKHGYTGANIAQAINDVQRIMQGDTNIQTNGVLRALLKDEMDVAGVSSWNNQSAKMDYFNRVAPALYQAVGQTSVAPLPLFAERLAAEEASANRRARYAKSLEGLPPTGNNFPIVTREIPVGAVKNDRALSFTQYNARQLGLDLKNRKARNLGVHYLASVDLFGNVKMGNIPAQLYVTSDRGRLKTRSEFMKHGKTEAQKRALGNYYDGYVTPYVAKYFNGNTKEVTFSKMLHALDKEISDVASTGTSTFIHATPIPVGTIDEAIKKSANIASSRAFRIGLNDKDPMGWKIIDAKNTVSEILNDAKENNKPVSFDWTSMRGNEGIVLMSGEDQYIIPFKEMRNSLAQEILYGIDQMNKATNPEDKANYHQGITSEVNYLMGGVYLRPSFDTMKQGK